MKNIGYKRDITPKDIKYLSAEAAAKRIRRKAREIGCIATSTTRKIRTETDLINIRYWWLLKDGIYVSSASGMNDNEAWQWLLDLA